MNGTRARKRKNPEVFPLSPSENLDKESKTWLKIYHKYMASAFQNPAIHNIAVTGDYGVGKSSLIRTFDKTWKPKGAKFSWRPAKTSFLYVTLGEFQKWPERHVEATRADGGVLPQTNPGEEQSDSEREIENLERRLLLQIYTQFRKRQFTAPLVYVQEPIRGLRCICFLAGLAVFSLLCVAFHEKGLDILDALQQVDDSLLPTWLDTQLEWIVKWEDCIYALMCVYLLAFTSVATGILIRIALPFLSLRGMSLKYKDMEVALEKGIEENLNLKKNILELICALEDIAPDIKGVVVFEDLDMFSREACLDIFTKLRELNFMLNRRLTRKFGAKAVPVRFIYVLNDQIAGQFAQSKFFDFVLPVIPTLHRDNALRQFERRWLSANEKLGLRFTQISDDFQFISDYPALIDYRTQFSILNDYCLLYSLYRDLPDAHDLNQRDAEGILAAAIYRNQFLEDYRLVRVGTCLMLSTYHPNNINRMFEHDAEKKQLFDNLYRLIDNAPGKCVCLTYREKFAEN